MDNIFIPGVPTFSTIRAGNAELSDWYLIEGHPDNGLLLCRIVLRLQRWVLVLLEDTWFSPDRLMWLPNDGSIQFIPTEPAEDRGISPVAKAAEEVRVRESLQQSAIESFGRSAVPGLLGDHAACDAGFPPIIVDLNSMCCLAGNDHANDPGTPPDLR